MTQSNCNKVYPGMINASTEFFIEDETLFVIQNKKIEPFSKLSASTIVLLEEEIEKASDVKKALFSLHPFSAEKRLKQFVSCRFGGLDFQADVKEGKLQEGEFWDCSKRGNCVHEGVLCKLPFFKNNVLTPKDIQLMKLIATNKTNEAIADEMNLPMGSFHKCKWQLYKKLEAQTKHEVVLAGVILNVIKL